MTTTLAVMAGALFAVGIWRRSEDAKWCENAVTAGRVLGDPQQVSALLEQQRSACAQQRRHQRFMFGAMWRKGGTAVAQCGFELARLQMLFDNRQARQAILQPYGLEHAEFDGVGLAQQDQFIKACLARS